MVSTVKGHKMDTLVAGPHMCGRVRLKRALPKCGRGNWNKAQSQLVKTTCSLLLLEADSRVTHVLVRSGHSLFVSHYLTKGCTVNER